MAFDKVIDSAKLDSAITATANAIRLKTGTSEKIQWEENTGFAGAVEAITVGGGSSEDSKQIVMEEHTFTGFEATAMPGVTAYEVAFGGNLPAFEIVEGQEYVVVWDDTEWTVTARDASVIAPGALFLGNGTIAGLEQNGEPFAIGWHTGGLLLYYYGTDVAEHKVSIYKQAFVGSLDDLRYVTFMNDDGTVEYGKKAVATGDDCADPIARGIFDTPIKESTAQYHYTFSGGWATVPNGGIDENALKAVNEDRTVYANFISAVRYYTVTYYDSDGTTVLKTESLAYGATPSYNPTKTGFVLEGWSPSLSPVTGDISYMAVWTEKITFAGGTWADIARIAESGEASKHFAVGDRKVIPVKWLDGTTTDLEVEIIGINHDNLANGSGKAGITIGTVHVISYYDFLGSNQNLYKITFPDGWEKSSYRTALNDLGIKWLPQEMTQYIKTVKKESKTSYSNFATTTTEDKLFIPSSTEACGTIYTNVNPWAYYGTKYQGYSTEEKRMRHRQKPTGIEIDGTNANGYCNWAVRENNSSKFTTYVSGSDGKIRTNASENNRSCICWCI